MARPAVEIEDTKVDIVDGNFPVLNQAVEALNQEALVHQQTNDNALAVARQVGYDGTLTVGALEDEIRFYQRRSVEACIELGKRLLILKELTPHGEFEPRVELLGFTSRMARKFMSATLKFSNRNSSSVLTAAGTQTKMLELLVLDDGEVEALESGETVRGVTLDKIETMSVSELKKALRDKNATLQAKDELLASKNKKIDELGEKVIDLEAKKRNVSAEQRLLDLRSNLQISAADIKAAVMTRLRRDIKALLEHAPDDQKAFAATGIIEITHELLLLRDEYHLPASINESLKPEWLSDDEWQAMRDDDESAGQWTQADIEGGSLGGLETLD